jgi:hypothetical protein
MSDTYKDPSSWLNIHVQIDANITINTPAPNLQSEIDALAKLNKQHETETANLKNVVQNATEK